MKKFLLLICISTFNLPSLSCACVAPKTGAQYDALIEVNKIGKNNFKVTISKKAGILDYRANITVGYYSKSDEYRFVEYWKKIDTKEEGNNYVATFDLKKIEGYIPFVQVYWPPKNIGLCGAYGKSEDLQIE